MAEQKMDYNIGHIRMKYLDMANMSFTQGNYKECEGFITAFLETIKDDGAEADMIRKNFDSIERIKRERKRDLSEHIKDLGELERVDTKAQGELEITIESLLDRKTICWNVAMKQGLFHE